MTSSADHTTTASRVSGGCDCDHCQGGDLRATPFVGPRITHGMLLGEDDFSALTSYPRGKHRLHQAWSTGPGVVWGYPVSAHGLYELRIGPGLAVDGAGRELWHGSSDQRDLRTVVTDWLADGTLEPPPDDCAALTVHAWVVARFSCCLTSPVPVTADPCDVTRTHDDYSRVAESAAIEVRFGRAPARLGERYRRVRMLLGVLALDDSPAADDARAARDRVRTSGDPAAELQDQLWRLACRDSVETSPADPHGGWLPVLEEDAVVPLAGLCFTLVPDDGCWTFDETPEVDACVRTALLPTDVITALTAGLAPALVDGAAPAVLGPQVDAGAMSFEDGRRTLVVPVTAPLVPGTLDRNVEVTTLASGDGEEWVVEDVFGARYEAGAQVIRIRLGYPLDDRAADALVRVRIRGTGGRPVMGAEPLLPLAGVVGRPPGDPEDGRDAVWTFINEPTTEVAE